MYIEYCMLLQSFCSVGSLCNFDYVGQSLSNFTVINAQKLINDNQLIVDQFLSINDSKTTPAKL